LVTLFPAIFFGSTVGAKTRRVLHARAGRVKSAVHHCLVYAGRGQQVDESSDEARHIRQLEQLLEQKESEMVIQNRNWKTKT